MAEKSEISWTDSTINFWSGCTMVPAANGLKDSGCLYCYAKDRDDRHLQEKVSHWGIGAPRLKSVGAVKDALALNRKPFVCDKFGQDCDCYGVLHGRHRRRIFSLSLGDWLDDEVPIEWLAEMLDTIQKCDQVTWILCTKRPENWMTRLMDSFAATDSDELKTWVNGWICGTRVPSNITPLISIENQAMADKRIPELLKIPSACRGLSLEPLLGPVELNLNTINHDAMKNGPQHAKQPFISWLIIGAESGPHRRECKLEWVRSLVEQGKAAGCAVFVKQLQDSEGIVCKDVAEFPKDLQIQNWPKGF
jgi:protein gp37